MGAQVAQVLFLMRKKIPAMLSISQEKKRKGGREEEEGRKEEKKEYQGHFNWEDYNEQENILFRSYERYNDPVGTSFLIYQKQPTSSAQLEYKVQHNSTRTS